MAIEIREEPIANLVEHGEISIAFEVKSRYRVDVVDSGLGGIKLIEEIVEQRFVKDYDKEAEGGPERWLKRWELKNWGLLAAFDGDKRVGGAVLAWRTDYVDMLEKRDDLTVMWDLRIDPDYRGKGIGQTLFKASEDWARARQCKLFKVETGTDNVPACKFYSRQGCTLEGVNRYAYKPEGIGEWQLLWYKPL